MSTRFTLFGLALLGIIMAGCSLFKPRYPNYRPRMIRDTAQLEVSQLRSRCDPLQDTAFCDIPDRFLNRAHVVLWNGYLKAHADSGGLPHMNGYPMEPFVDHHGGPWYHFLPDTVPVGAVRCDGGYNVVVVPAVQDMPPIVDSIRIPGRFELLEPSPGDTIGFDSVLVRWSPIPGERLTIGLYGERAPNGRYEWTIDAGLGSYVIPASDLESYRGNGLYLVSLRLVVSTVGSTAGRPYALTCWCRDDIKVWMRAR